MKTLGRLGYFLLWAWFFLRSWIQLSMVDYCVVSNWNPYELEYLQTSIQVHFIHGSFSSEDCPYGKERLGGVLGGHVEIEVDSIVYGFELEDKQAFHYWARSQKEHYNAKVTKMARPKWDLANSHERITSIEIPVTFETAASISQTLEAYYHHVPYDYAFLGMRCTANVTDVLSQHGILPVRHRYINILTAFYPRQLRYKLLQMAEIQSYEITMQKGVECRNWEG